MSQKIVIRSADDVDIPVYVFEPKGNIKGAIVLLQEIFGVNQHIKEVAQNYSDTGYIVYTPDIFHRIKQGIELGYEEKDIQKGLEYKDKIGWDIPIMDIVSCAADLKSNHKVAVLGYCFGGSLSWRANQKSHIFDACISFYGSSVSEFIDIEPKSPTMLHFGLLDKGIPKNSIDKIEDFSSRSKKEINVYTYQNADHGFNCNKRNSYNKEAAALAWERSISFLEKYI